MTGRDANSALDGDAALSMDSMDLTSETHLEDETPTLSTTPKVPPSAVKTRGWGDAADLPMDGQTKSNQSVRRPESKPSVSPMGSSLESSRPVRPARLRKRTSKRGTRRSMPLVAEQQSPVNFEHWKVSTPKAAFAKADPEPLVQALRAGEVYGNSQSASRSNVSGYETKLSARTPSRDTVARKVAAQGLTSASTDTSVEDPVDDDIEDMDSTSNNGDFPRSPSPWQAASNWGSPQPHVEILTSTDRGLDGISDSQADSRRYPNSSRVDASVTSFIHRATGHVAGSGSGDPSSAAGRRGIYPGSLAASFGAAGSKRTSGSRGSTGDSGDGDQNEPVRRRPKKLNTDMTLDRPRFACPYQKYDPDGSPFCCMPSTRNPEGGADTFSRVK